MSTFFQFLPPFSSNFFFLLTFNKLFWLWQKAGKIAENSSAEIEFRCWLSSVCKCPNPKSSCVGWLEFFTHFLAFFVFLPICNFPHFLNVKKITKLAGNSNFTNLDMSVALSVKIKSPYTSFVTYHLDWQGGTKVKKFVGVS